MSSRRSEVQSSNTNPAKKFLSWSSQNQALVYYDKEKSENVLVKTPFTFLYLADRTTVKGYDAEDNTGIYSNEVKAIKEELNVRNFKNKTIAVGQWNDISQKVDRSGGKFAKSIYAMTKKGNLINLCLYGSALREWFEFTKKSKRRLPDEWVTITGVEERKKGVTNYFVPVFSYNKSLSSDEGEMADKAYEMFEEFEKGENPRKIEVNDAEVVDYAAEPAPTPPPSEDDLAF